MSKQSITAIRLEGPAAQEVEKLRNRTGIFAGQEVEQRSVSSVEELQALLTNEPLLLLSDTGPGAERDLAIATNHRVNNTLQNIVSFLNLHFQRKGIVSTSDLNRLTRHITGLAHIHRLLAEHMENRPGRLVVKLDKLFAEILPGHSGMEVESYLEECEVLPRQAVALTTIINELVGNCKQHGATAAHVDLTAADGQASLKVRGEGAPFPVGFDAERDAACGLTMVLILCRRELESEPRFSNCGESSLVELEFKLPPPSGAADEGK